MDIPNLILIDENLEKSNDEKYSISNDKKDSDVSSYDSQDSKDEFEPEEYSLLSKWLLVVGSLGMAWYTYYAQCIFNAVPNQFQQWYDLGENGFFWFTQIFLIVQVILMIPLSFLFEKYMKLCSSISVLIVILGSLLVYFCDHNTSIRFYAQILLALSTEFSIVSPAAIGALIFDLRQNQFFVAAMFTSPMILTVFTILIPPFYADELGTS